MSVHRSPTSFGFNSIFNSKLKKECTECSAINDEFRLSISQSRLYTVVTTEGPTLKVDCNTNFETVLKIYTCNKQQYF